MISESLIKQLKAQMDRSIAFFDEPPNEVAERYGLAPDVPIDILIGPDVEARLIKDGKNILADKNRTEEFEETFMFPFFEQLTDALRAEQLVWKGEKGSVFLDGQSLEYVLKPSSPYDLCDIQIRAAELVEELATKNGITAHAGNGHPHMSFSQNGVDILMRDHRFSDFFRAILSGMHAFQNAFPAFFVKPKIAENEHIEWSRLLVFPNKLYRGPHKLCFNRTDSQAAIRAKWHTSARIMTIEPRLATHAPYSPVALYLAAAQYGVTTGGRAIQANLSHNYMTCSLKYLHTEGDFKGTSDGAALVQRGEFGYLEMLEETLENLNRFNPLTQDLAHSLIVLAIEDYRNYLQTPMAQSRYDPDAIHTINAKLADLKHHVDTAFASSPSADATLQYHV